MTISANAKRVGTGIRETQLDFILPAVSCIPVNFATTSNLLDPVWHSIARRLYVAAAMLIEYCI